MLVIPFVAGHQGYCVAAADVERVIPWLPLRTLPGAPPELVGLLHHGARWLPVVDAASVLGARPAQRRLSTRILLCAGVSPWGNCLGLLCERVTDALDAREEGDAGVRLTQAPWLGRLLAAGETTLQQIHPSRLLTPALAAMLGTELAEP